MLFAIKNRWLPSLALASVFALTAMGMRRWLGLTWNWELGARELSAILLATLLIAVSDGGLHFLLGAALGDRYRTRYHELAEYFRPQRNAEITCGAVLASAEELVFRGVLLTWLATRMHVAAAVIVTAIVFGLAHWLPRHRLAPFTIWAVWEGVLLGLVYVLSGSLAVSVVVHGAHDAVGFLIFRRERTHSPGAE